ncbi:DUF4817 domain-containing protein [Trichonephila inaurata madagascariensis]|uniref:DUF4817 domain-containing protein n=1 Tax=Trichonephila inaurata madagascariensis TaxID=2747483 RepID=A0A8X6IJ73_9ARAC|nr:DUF4817 domain-containing protein [Trichonephila inaurata madagascariensis]
MAPTKIQKAFCAVEYAKTMSFITVQLNFRQQFGVEAPDKNSIKRWHTQLMKTGCLCKGKSTGRPYSEETFDKSLAILLWNIYVDVFVDQPSPIWTTVVVHYAGAKWDIPTSITVISISNSSDHDQRHASGGRPSGAEETASSSSSCCSSCGPLQRLHYNSSGKSPGQPLVPPVTLHALLQPPLVAALHAGQLLQLLPEQPAAPAAPLFLRLFYGRPGTLETAQRQRLHHLERSQQLRECPTQGPRAATRDAAREGAISGLHRIGAAGQRCRPGRHRTGGEDGCRADGRSAFHVPGVGFLPSARLLPCPARGAAVGEEGQNCVRPVHLCAVVVCAPQCGHHPGDGRFLHHFLLLLLCGAAAPHPAATAAAPSIAGDAHERYCPSAAATTPTGGAWGARGGGQPQKQSLEPLDSDES